MLQAKGSRLCNDALGQELCGIADLLPARCTCCACVTNPSTCMRLAHLVSSPQHFQAQIAVHCWALMTSSTVLLCRRRCPDCQRLPQRLYSGSEGIHACICECHWHLGRLLRNTGVSVRPILGMLLYTRMSHTPFHKPAHLQPHVLEAAQLPGAKESQLLEQALACWIYFSLNTCYCVPAAGPPECVQSVSHAATCAVQPQACRQPAP